MPLEEPVHAMVARRDIALLVYPPGQFVVVAVRHDRLMVVLIGPSSYGYFDPIMPNEFAEAAPVIRQGDAPSVVACLSSPVRSGAGAEGTGTG